MHIIVNFQQSTPVLLLKTAHQWLATGGNDRFSFDIASQRVDFPQGCTYSDRLKNDICKLLGDENAVTVVNEPMRQLSLIDVTPISNYGD